MKRLLIEKHLRLARIPATKFAEHIAGWNLSEPVYEELLQPGERLMQFVSNATAVHPDPRPGNYYTYVGGHGMPTIGVGSGLAGRSRAEFQVARPVLALLGTAAPISATTAARFGQALRGAGGATQIFLHDRGVGTLVAGNADLRHH
ncbi:MAG: hypothetical protein WEF50_15860 [Myxococcota bacterium]